ncbi:hypothetical protein CQW23_23565 [Capsicum baccatum]|uniref:Uncharacterized protein n=1 Tax=Capsicum baccatum TaxID=33114 RepID=A0A2G2VSC2_CAPBA|nr:hypothetical protein CQW23_23565 [Capsicum baccatum]
MRNPGEMNYIIKKIRDKKKFPKSLDMLITRDGKFKKMTNFVKLKKRMSSHEFEEMVLTGLWWNLDNRPIVGQLLNSLFFSIGIEKFKKFVLNGTNPDNRPTAGELSDVRFFAAAFEKLK